MKRNYGKSPKESAAEPERDSGAQTGVSRRERPGDYAQRQDRAAPAPERDPTILRLVRAANLAPSIEDYTVPTPSEAEREVLKRRVASLEWKLKKLGEAVRTLQAQSDEAAVSEQAFLAELHELASGNRQEIDLQELPREFDLDVLLSDWH